MTQLKRARIILTEFNVHLVMVADDFSERGRIVHRTMSKEFVDEWRTLEWLAAWEELEEQWRLRFE